MSADDVSGGDSEEEEEEKEVVLATLGSAVGGDNVNVCRRPVVVPFALSVLGVLPTAELPVPAEWRTLLLLLLPPPPPPPSARTTTRTPFLNLPYLRLRVCSSAAPSPL